MCTKKYTQLIYALEGLQAPEIIECSCVECYTEVITTLFEEQSE